jgi:hypothetical protein
MVKKKEEKWVQNQQTKILFLPGKKTTKMSATGKNTKLEASLGGGHVFCGPR